MNLSEASRLGDGCRRVSPRRSSRGPSSYVSLSILVALAILAAGAAAPAQQAPARRKELTVERIYSEPSLEGSRLRGAVWSPDGKLLTYLSTTRGGPEAGIELTAIVAETGARRVLISADKLRELSTGEAESRGQQTGLGRHPPSEYFWSPRGDAILFLSSGSLFWFDLKAQASRRLTDGRQRIADVKISPDGRTVSFLRNHDVWLVDVSSGRERQLTSGGGEQILNGELDWVYPEELDIRTAYWWSPDSSQIAYLQMNESAVTKYPLVDFLSYTGDMEIMRYPKAGGANPTVRVGVIPVAGGPTRWMDTGQETDIYLPRVAWLPDSKRLAIQRLNRAQNQLDLLFADATDGRSQMILIEKDPYWVNVAGDPEFLNSGRQFLWTSERDGFRHIYLYDLEGKLIRRVTEGPWMVTEIVGVDQQQNVIYFVSTEKSPLERHLYRYSLAGGGIARLTTADGTHQISMAPGAAHFLDTYSNVTTPPRQDLYRADDARLAVVNENGVPELTEYGLPTPEFGIIKGEGGVELYAMMIRPSDFDPAHRYPVLIYTYGGPGAQVVQNAWGGRNYLWLQMMAQKGYITFLLDNRGSTGRGHAFETPIFHHMARVELTDQLAGVAYLKSLPYVNGERIGIWGWSYGGYMTCNAMFNAPGVFRAAFAGAPVTDWRQYDTIYTERYMGRPQENPEGYRDSSPVTHVAGLSGKLLIVHATGDDNVHFANEAALAEALIRAGRYVELLIYPGRGHGISDPPARIHVFNRVTRFFLDNL